MSDTPLSPAPDRDIVARVRALAEEALDGSDLYLVDVVVRGGMGGRVVEVFAESDAGAGSDDIVAYSRRLSFLMDTEDPIKGRYRLDVSTPGADRPLKLPRQYGRHVGRDLRVVLAPDEGSAEDAEGRVVTGRLAEAGPDAFALDLSGSEEPLRVPYESVREARVVLPW